MGLLVEFDLIDDFGYLDMTEEYQIIPDYTEGNEVFVETFLELSKDLVPIDTGFLRSTLEAGCDDTSCYAKTDCEYAQYPEFGTWCQPAQPYFRPALEQALLMAQPYWDMAEMEALIEEEMLLEEEAEEEAIESFEKGSRGTNAVGGLNFSSFGGFIGSLIGMLLVAIITTTIQAMTGHDFKDTSNSRINLGSGIFSAVFMPEITII